MSYQQIDIELYKGTPPNKKNGLHIFCSGIYDFRTKITNSYYYPNGLTEYKGVQADNFRFNNGYLILKAEDITEADLNEITYVVEYTRKSGTAESSYANMRCFFVESAYFQSGNAYLKINLDKWGTYNRLATLSHCHITRCNRAIGNGIYDTIKTTKGATYPVHPKPYSLTLAQCCAVFLLEYNVSQNLFGGNQITKTSLMFMTFKDMYDTLHNFSSGNFHGSDYDNIDIVAKVIDLLGGIHSVGGTIGTAGAQLNAHVLKVWFIPTEAIATGTLGLQQVVTKSLLTGGNDMPFNNLVYEVGQQHYVKALNYKNTLDNPAAQWAEFLPQYHIEIGTLYRSMPINRFTQDTTAYFHFVTTNSGVNVYVEEGLKQEDITESFEVTITLNNATETSLMQATKTFAKMAASIAAVAKGYMKGGYAGAAAGAVVAGIGLMATTKDAQPLQAIGTGDGALTFSQNRPQSVNSPYYLMLTNSNDDENEHVRFMGAQFDLYNDDFAGIQSLSYLGSYSGSAPAGTFIQIDDLHVSGLNDEAEEYFRSELARGIWYKVI